MTDKLLPGETTDDGDGLHVGRRRTPADEVFNVLAEPSTAGGAGEEWVRFTRDEIRLLAELAGVMPDTAKVSAEVRCGNCNDPLLVREGFTLGEGSTYAVDAPTCDCQTRRVTEKVGGLFGSTKTRTVRETARKHVSVTLEDGGIL